MPRPAITLAAVQSSKELFAVQLPRSVAYHLDDNHVKVNIRY